MQEGLRLALFNREYDKIKTLMLEGVIDSNGNTPLHVILDTIIPITDSNVIKIIADAIKKSGNFNTINKRGSTVLHLAIQNDHIEIARSIIQNGKGIDFNIQDCLGNTALHYAAEYGYRDIIEMLIERGADVNIVNVFDKTPLISSLGLGANKPENVQDIVKSLVEKGANINFQGKKSEYINLRNSTPLHLAIQNNHLNAAKFLVECENIDLNCEDVFHRTPLYLAIECRKKVNAQDTKYNVLTEIIGIMQSKNAAFHLTPFDEMKLNKKAYSSQSTKAENINIVNNKCIISLCCILVISIVALCIKSFSMENYINFKSDSKTFPYMISAMILTILFIGLSCLLCARGITPVVPSKLENIPDHSHIKVNRLNQNKN